jgi:hypothetical protein
MFKVVQPVARKLDEIGATRNANDQEDVLKMPALEVGR